jgi:uncharacterized protein (TIGR02145 family)
MKKLLILIGIFCVLNVNAQDYVIVFKGATPITSVQVENLITGEKIVLDGKDVLHLTGTPIITGIIDNKVLAGMIIYPNPVTNNNGVTIKIKAPVPGEADVMVFDMTGRLVARVHSFLDNSTQEFKLSNLNNGFYVISIQGNNYKLSGKLLSTSNFGGNVILEKISGSQIVDVKEIKKIKEIKSTQEIIDMIYSSGERLKFTAVSGNFGTVITDIPESNKIETFDFMACTDGDGNNYPIVKIGNQVWMEENLRTSKYNDGTPIPKVIDNTVWGNLGVFDSLGRYTITGAYCWYNNDSAANNRDYGKLYNFGTIMTGKICPVDWHMPSITEWFTLDAPYKIDTGFPNQTKPRGLGLMETGTKHWNNPIGTNESGFTALPGGIRTDAFGDHTYYVPMEYAKIGQSSYFYSSGRWMFPDAALFQIVPFTINFGNTPSSCMIGTTSGLSIRCIKDQPLPLLTTTEVSNITQTDASSGGNISENSDITIGQYGVCWSTSENPTVSDRHTQQGSGAGTFTSQISGLTPSTKYYVRAYASNVNGGIGYGNQVSFTTLTTSPSVFNPDLTYGTVTDVEGNVYKTIQIGTQLWMAENLRTTTYNDNTPIPLVTDDVLWSSLSTFGYCWLLNNSDAYKNTYGGLYNWYAINTNKLCPSGFHIPTDDEWSALALTLGGDSIAGARLKETGTTHWLTPNIGATNESGFTGLPGGIRSDDSYGTYGIFDYSNQLGFYWTSSQYDNINAWCRITNSNDGNLNRDNRHKSGGFSVRCLSDIQK